MLIIIVPTIQQVYRLETIPEELSEECHGDDGRESNREKDKTLNQDNLIEEQESNLDDSLSNSSVENCESCGEHSEEQPSQAGSNKNKQLF